LELQSIVDNILKEDYDWYDVKKLSWCRYLYRIRVWKYRIIFQKKERVTIIKIDTRWNIYKGL
jgi:mRNA-degrading endonuclease RelE of RelBE toxin-antitoxin system